MVADRVTWTGLNVRELAKVCRSLLNKNSADMANPVIWIVGMSRFDPGSNTVSIRLAEGLVKVKAGDTIVRHPDDTYTVERANVT